MPCMMQGFVLHLWVQLECHRHFLRLCPTLIIIIIIIILLDPRQRHLMRFHEVKSIEVMSIPIIQILVPHQNDIHRLRDQDTIRHLIHRHIMDTLLHILTGGTISTHHNLLLDIIILRRSTAHIRHIGECPSTLPMDLLTLRTQEILMVILHLPLLPLELLVLVVKWLILDTSHSKLLESHSKLLESHNKLLESHHLVSSWRGLKRQAMNQQLSTT
mmetsp:Transcript_32078/g.45607  ORF Transcript_32078/g.45607 Transcript_32078/m.45607 type:complete len:216 (+) Transcript_32078:571-1218(+)